MRSRSFPVLAAAGAALAGLALTGCATGSTEASETPDSVTSADAEAFPVTIDHAFGSTTIEKEPQRVATLGWSDQDNALALGVVPVGATKLTWGGNDAGSSDWFDATLEESGADAPVLHRPGAFCFSREPACARREPFSARTHETTGMSLMCGHLCPSMILIADGHKTG